jgi:ABC-type multidrug transport system fused ATPase/permease subunit
MNDPLGVLGQGRGWLVLRLVLLGAGQAVAAAATILLVRASFDALFAGADAISSGLYISVASLLGLTLLLLVLRVWERHHAEELGQRYTTQVRLTLFAHLLTLPLPVLRQRPRGLLMLRFSGNLSALRLWASQGLARLLVGIIALPGALAVLAAISPPLALAVGVILTGLALVMIMLGPRLLTQVRRARREQGRLASAIGDRLGAVATIQGCGQSQREWRRVRRQSEQLMAAMVARTRAAAWIRLLPEAGGGLVTALIVLLGAWALAQGTVTPGTLVAALAVAGLLQPHLNALARVYDYWQNCRAAREHLRAFLALPSLHHPRRTAPLTVDQGQLRLEGLTVNGVLEDIRGSVKPGSLIVVTGGNGSGKSTLLATAAGLLLPDAGRVTIDGQDLADCTLESIRQTIGLASPELPLLQGSFTRNLCYRHPRATAEEIQEVCRRCGLESAIANLPKGLKTRIGEGGHKLPPGVRQRLMLARALLGNPPILVLDEVDAGLDEAGQHVLEQLLRERQATTLLVTHNPRHLDLADSIWRLDSRRLTVLAGGRNPQIAHCLNL